MLKYIKTVVKNNGLLCESGEWDMEKSMSYKNIVGLRFLRNIKRQTNDLYLVHCGHQQCPPNYTYDHKIPNEYHLHFVLDGKGRIEMNGKVYHVKKEDIFMIFKDVPMKYFADEDEPWEYMWVTFDGYAAEEYVNKIGLSPEKPVATSAIPVKTYFPMVKKILDAYELTIANEIKRVGYLFEIIATLIEAQASLEKGKRQYDYSSEAYVDYALQYIKTNYAHIKVNDIAKYIGINRSYFTSIFKKKMNMSPQDYLMNCRLKKAEELIKTTNLSFKEISETVGYENPLTFSKMFKQAYGCSPKSYRENNKDE
jgi:AraC family transcriptional regulator of arabinose operon